MKRNVEENPRKNHVNILKYFPPKSTSHIPLAALASVDTEVMKVMMETSKAKSKRKGQHYHKYTQKMRAATEEPALEKGIPSAKRFLLESYILILTKALFVTSRMPTLYVLEKKESNSKKDTPVFVMVQYYISKLRKKGVINSRIVISAATGILMSQNRISLSQFGSHITLTVSWAKSFLRRMHFMKRCGTTFLSSSNN